MLGKVIKVEVRKPKSGDQNNGVKTMRNEIKAATKKISYPLVKMVSKHHTICALMIILSTLFVLATAKPIKNQSPKPCPFCHSKRAQVYETWCGEWTVECHACNAEGSWKDTAAEAVNNWNKVKR